MKLSSLAGLLHRLQKGSAPLFRTSPHLMKKKAMCVCIVLLLVYSSFLCSCSVSNRVLIRYYSEKSNYVTASGAVDHIQDDPELDGLYLGFSELSPSMDDVTMYHLISLARIGKLFCKGASCKKFSWERRSVS